MNAAAAWELAEQAYYDVTRPLRVAAARARWTFSRESLAVCDACGAPALWRYAPAGPRMEYCDNCVPRGCECQVIDHSIPARMAIDPPDAAGREFVWTVYEGGAEPEQRRDARGRLLPCCEFEYSAWGWPK